MKERRMGAQLLPVTDGMIPMSNEARGADIQRRRVALFGNRSVDKLAKAAGVVRQTVSRAEAGDARTSNDTYMALEATLERLEAERAAGVETNPAEVSPQPEATPGQITFRAVGISSEAFNIDELIVDSSPDVADEARRQFLEVLQEIRRTQSGGAPDERP